MRLFFVIALYLSYTAAAQAHIPDSFLESDGFIYAEAEKGCLRCMQLVVQHEISSGWLQTLPHPKFYTSERTELAAASHENCANVLQKWGVNSADANHATPLMWSAASDSPLDVECIQSLVQQGALLQADDVKGRAALHHAAWSGSTRSVEILLALGANADFLDYGSQLALHFALRSPWHSTQKSKLLINATNVAALDAFTVQGLLAHSSGDAVVLQALLQELATSHPDTDLSCTAAAPAPCPLMIAIQGRCEECVSLLLAAGADPLRTSVGGDALQRMASHLRLPQATRLLQQRMLAAQQACEALHVPPKYWSASCILWAKDASSLSAWGLLQAGVSAQHVEHILTTATTLLLPEYAAKHKEVFGFVPAFTPSMLQESG